MKLLIPIAVTVLIVYCFFTSCGDGNSGKAKVEVYDSPVFEHPSIQSINKQLEAQPQSADLYFKRGIALMQLQADSLALRDFRKAISLDSNKAEYYSAIGELHFEHKDLDASVVWLKKAIEKNPQDPRAHLKMAKMLMFMQESNKAFEEINLVLRKDAYNPEAYFLKGMIYKDLKDTTKAISSFQSAIQSAPDYKDAIVQLGQIYAAQGNDLALQYYDNAYKADTLDVFPLFAKGVYYQKKLQFELAKEAYRKCVLKEQQYADAYYNMGSILIQQDSFEKAKRQFELITRIIPNDAEAYYFKGLCNEKLGNKEQAIEDYEQALVFNKDLLDAEKAIKKLQSKK